MSRRRIHQAHPDPKKLRFSVSDDAVKIFRYTDGENPFFNSPVLNTGLEDLQWLRNPENLVKGNFRVHSSNLDQGRYRVDQERVDKGGVKVNDWDQLTGSIFHDGESEDEKDDDDLDHEPLKVPNSRLKLMHKAANAVSNFYKNLPKNAFYIFLGTMVLLSLLTTSFSNYDVSTILLPSLPEALKYPIPDPPRWFPTQSASLSPVEEPHTVWTGPPAPTTISQHRFLKAPVWLNPANWPAMTDFVKGTPAKKLTIQTISPTTPRTFNYKPTQESQSLVTKTIVLKGQERVPGGPKPELFDRLLSLNMALYNVPLLPIPHLPSLYQTTHHASQTFKFSAWQSIPHSPYENDLIIFSRKTKSAIQNLETVLSSKDWKDLVGREERVVGLLKETLGEMEELEGHQMGNLRERRERVKTERKIVQGFHDLLFLGYHNAEKLFTQLHALKFALLELPNDVKDFEKFISLEKKTRKSKGNKHANEGLKGEKEDLAKLVALKKGLLPDIEEVGKGLEKLLEGKKNDLVWFGKGGEEDREFDYEGVGVQIMGLRALLRDVERRVEEMKGLR